MKTFIGFECVFAMQDIKVGGILYKKNELYKLDGYCFPVHKYFIEEEEVVTMGKLYWNNCDNYLLMQMWLSPSDLNFFERYIISGSLVPCNVRLTPDTVQDDSVKAYFE
jgi:hypothetical protein